MFTIQGSPEATERALMLLYSQLESEKERRECTPFRVSFWQRADGLAGVNGSNSEVPASADFA